MLKSRGRSLLSTKEVAFVNEESPIDKTSEFAPPSSRQRESTASTTKYRAPTSSAYGHSVGTSEMKNSRASSASFESLRAFPCQRFAEDSVASAFGIFPEFPESESTIQACSIAKIKDQIARPKSCGYHESFLFKNGDRWNQVSTFI
jgi:hypothetical protein